MNGAAKFVKAVLSVNLGYQLVKQKSGNIHYKYLTKLKEYAAINPPKIFNPSRFV